MGTSTGYDMPTGGDWTPLKREATKFVKDEGEGGDDGSPVSNPALPESLLRRFMQTHGGARSFARGTAGSGGGARGIGNQGGGTGNRGGVGRAARSTGRALGGFLSGVGSVGLDAALRDVGLSHLIGQPAADVATGLLDALAAPANTLDEHATRRALAKINEELIGDARTYEDVEQALSNVLDTQGLGRIIMNFFGEYLYQLFCRDFYENWSKRVGASQADRKLKSIKDCIKSGLKAKVINLDVSKIKWFGREGLRITQQVMQETLGIFEVT